MERPEKIETFMYALIKNASMISRVEFFENWGISEEEMNECIKYVKEKLEVNNIYA